jgi:hypothetical protein
MKLYNTFPTFAESETAQAYDFNRFCAKKFSEITGIDLDIILELDLHLDSTLRHQYYADNGITFTPEQKLSIHNLVNYFNCTNRWANTYLYNDAYVYLVCPDSDVAYSTIDLSLDEVKSLKALNDDGVYIPATDWESL